MQKESQERARKAQAAHEEEERARIEDEEPLPRPTRAVQEEQERAGMQDEEPTHSTTCVSSRVLMNKNHNLYINHNPSSLSRQKPTHQALQVDRHEPGRERPPVEPQP